MFAVTHKKKKYKKRKYCIKWIKSFFSIKWLNDQVSYNFDGRKERSIEETKVEDRQTDRQTDEEDKTLNEGWKGNK